MNKGIGFTGLQQGAYPSLTRCWHGSRRSRPSPRKRRSLGVFIGVTLVVSLVIMDQACIWGAEWNLVSNLLDLEPSTAVLYESGRRMAVREDMLLLFVRLEFAAVGLLALQCSVVLGCFSATGYQRPAVTLHERRVESTRGRGRGRWGGAAAWAAWRPLAGGAGTGTGA